MFSPFAAWSGSTTAACPQALTASIPVRGATAASANEFLSRLLEVTDDDREDLIRDQLLAGNMPQFLRKLRPVVIHRPRGAAITVCVFPDYLSVGSDSDFVITPMRLRTALAVARQYGFLLPTSKIVDSIYEQARVHMTAQPLPPGDQMHTTRYFWRHNDLIATQRADFSEPPGTLIAGHKKDLVITNRLWSHLSRVAIYGWQRADGRPIQPLSTVHGAGYADYSHAVRLVSETAYVDARPVRLHDLLQDPQWAMSLTGEGPIQRVEDLMLALADEPGSRVLQQRKPR